MRQFLLILAVFAFAPSLRADDAADAKAIIEKAIKARGDKPDNKFIGLMWKEKFKPDIAASQIATIDFAFQAPDKLRLVLTIPENNPPAHITVVVNGEKAWVNYGSGRDVEEITGDQLAGILPAINQYWVATLTPLITGGDFSLTTTKDKDVSGKPAAGVKVSSGKRPVATLYFDKATGLLVKHEAVVKQDGKEQSEELFFKDYKKVGGRMVYTKVTVLRDGKAWYESTVSDHKAVEKLDAKLFEQPVAKP